MATRSLTRPALALLATAVLGLTACGGGDEEESSSDSASSSSTSEDPGDSGSVDTSASGPASDGASGSPADETAARLEKMALPAADVPKGSGEGSSKAIPADQGSPLHLDLTGVTPSGACKTAIDQLNSGERKPGASHFTVTTLESGAEVQTGVIAMPDVDEAADDVSAVAKDCSTLEGPNARGEISALPGDDGFLVELTDGQQTLQVAMSLKPVDEETGSVVLMMTQDDSLSTDTVAEVVRAQSEHAEGALEG
ncbi:hypothetical protein [Kytococcus sp. Marseille-QA3725]